ncbi:hypothetical protein [Cetobacterium sp.]|uniref:hypothetical protein n=1 Tax=Cetobacterium sp. TaxID=2071632 RepID=UPI003F345A85
MIQKEIIKIQNELKSVYEEEKKIRKEFFSNMIPIFIILLIFISLYTYFESTKAIITKELFKEITLEQHYKDSKLYKEIYYNLDKSEILEIVEKQNNLYILEIREGKTSKFFIENTGLYLTKKYNLYKNIESFIENNRLRAKVEIITSKNEELFIYIEGLKNGPAQNIFEDGSVEIFSYKSGVKEGPAQKTFKNGNVEIFSYKLGLKEGLAQIIFENGSEEIFMYKLDKKIM